MSESATAREARLVTKRLTVGLEKSPPPHIVDMDVLWVSGMMIHID
jgi:hypothetical protein